LGLKFLNTILIRLMIFRLIDVLPNDCFAHYVSLPNS